MNPRRLSDPFQSWPDLYEFVQPGDEWSVVETKKLLLPRSRATAHNKRVYDAPFVDMSQFEAQ